MKRLRQCIPLVAIFMIHFSTLAFAQQEPAEGEKEAPKPGPEIGFQTGPMLPNQITGMTEILPLWGLRYGIPLKKAMLELGILNARAEGVVLYDAYISYRYDVHLDEISGMVIVGADLHQWSTAPNDTTRMVGGGHVGGGLMVPVGDTMWFRSEMKFNMNPGTSLFIGFGLVMRFSEEAGGDGR